MKMKKVIRMPLRRGPAGEKPSLPARRRPSSLRARAATAEDYDEDDYEGEEEPNMKLSHAIFVVLILHVIAVGGVFAFNSIKADQPDTAKTPTSEAAPAAVESSSAPEAGPATTAQTSAAPAAPASQAKTASGKTHTVQAGDTLTRIAAEHKTTIEAIELENGITNFSMIRVGQVLKIPAAGSVPAKVAPQAAPEPVKAVATAPAAPKPAAATNAAPVAAKTAPAEPKAETAAGEDGIYVVAKGDNPYSIAKKLHVSYSELIAANDIKDPTKIQIGQKLKVPKK